MKFFSPILLFIFVFSFSAPIMSNEIKLGQTSYGTLIDESAKLADLLGKDFKSSAIEIKKEEEILKLLNGKENIAVICPIPLKDEEHQEDLTPQENQLLKDTLESYLSLKKWSFIRTQSDIYTVLVIGVSREEILHVAKFFYQDFLFFSYYRDGQRINEYIRPRLNKGHAQRMGKGWSLSTEHGPKINLEEENKVFRFIFNIDDQENSRSI